MKNYFDEVDWIQRIYYIADAAYFIDEAFVSR